MYGHNCNILCNHTLVTILYNDCVNDYFKMIQYILSINSQNSTIPQNGSSCSYGITAVSSKWKYSSSSISLLFIALYKKSSLQIQIINIIIIILLFNTLSSIDPDD